MGGGGSGGVPSGCGEASVDALANGVWDPRFTIAGVTGHDGITPIVYDFALDADGAGLATVRFAFYERTADPPRWRLEDGHWLPARETWTFEPPGDGFSALAASEDGVLALATADSFGERDGEIWLDRDGQQESIGAFTGQVRSLAWFGDELYAAGYFQLAERLGAVENLAVWDGESWSGPKLGDANGPVLELLVSDGSLYVGGSFTSVGGVDAVNVAVFDGAAWSPLSLDGALAVYALARSDEGELYAGGALGDFQEAGGVVRRVGNAWELVGGGLAQFQTRGVVSDLVLHDGVLDVAGCFNAAGGLWDSNDAIETVGLARWDGVEWQSLNDGSAATSPWFQPGVCGDESVEALWDMEYQRLADFDGRLFAGGSFAGIEGVQTQSLAVRLGDAWEAQGAAGLGVSGSLDRVASGGTECALYGLGAFTHLGGKPAAGRVVRFEEGGWQLLEDELPVDAYCPALDVSLDDRLAVACMVFPEDGPARGVILEPDVDGERMVELAVDVDLPPIQALEWDRSGKLWIAGGDAAGFVASIEEGTLSYLSEGFDGPVQFLDVRDAEDLIAAGTFANVGTTPALHVAHYRQGAWHALGDGLKGQPQAIGRDDVRVYASTYDDGSGAYLLGGYDGEQWRELAGGDSGLAVEDYFSFNQILPVSGGLLLVGSAELEDGSGRGALLFHDGRFEAIGGGGVHAIITSGAAITEDAAWIGGVIAEAASDEPLSSVGVARLSW